MIKNKIDENKKIIKNNKKMKIKIIKNKIDKK